MKRIPSMPIIILAMTILWSCDVNETNQNSEIEDTILSMIAADDSSYAIDGLSNDDFTLGKVDKTNESQDGFAAEVLIDSNYIWRFGRSQMNSEREVTVEVENDSAAIALISHHITGVFHARQFTREWTGDSTWVMGDSVQFSEKPIDMTVDRRVAFRNRILPDGAERWIPTEMTLAYGSTGNTLDIQSIEWVSGDSIQVLDDFDTIFYGRLNPLSLATYGANQINVMVSNDMVGEAESVIGRFGYHPRLQGPDLRNRIHFRYVESFASGDKVYSRPILALDRPLRHFKGFIEVIDHRTLFDHDYADYSATTVGFVYTMRHRRP